MVYRGRIGLKALSLLLPLTVFSFLPAILNILLYKKVYIITFNGGSSRILLLYIGGCYIYISLHVNI